MPPAPHLPTIAQRALTDLPNAVFWFDERGRFFEANRKACEHWGYTREELLEKTIFDLNPNMSPDRWAAHWANKQVNTETFESSHRKKNGEEFPVDITDIFVEYEGVTYSCAIIQDITQRKEADRQARLADFTVQKAVDAIFWICPRGFIKQVNEAACRWYGYTKEEFLGKNLLEINRTVDPEGFRGIWEELKTAGQTLRESEHVDRAGRSFPVEIVAHYIEFEGMEYACANVRDISERKRKEAALRGALLEIRELKEKLEAENNYLQEEIEGSQHFGEIITQSKSFRKVLQKVEQVADTNSTVLITGESGTGKELIARAVHQLSRRHVRPMIKVNCAALPANLIESELFGHEKGAFTGALSRKIGKFELADGGTLFLDEIGELPIELQAKLLRALQEGEIERLGGSETRRVDIRVIAATNRNLEKEIDKGNFREDLYYRLNVFPIHSIPLRERPEDIPLLVRFFCEKLGSKLGRSIQEVPQKVINRLLEYDFPGNVRELENIVERGIITARAGKLNLGDWFRPSKKRLPPQEFKSLEAMQRQYIIEVLQHTNWRVSGERGAARLLDLRPTTLYSKMDRLGIKRSKQAE